MNDTAEGSYSLKELINTVKLFVSVLRRKAIYIVLAAIIGASLGCLYYFMQSPKYKATSTFILEEKSINSGGLAGIASQFGLNLGSLGGGSSIFSGDNILNILRSRKVIEQVLLSPIDSNRNISIADHYLDFTGMKASWSDNKRLADISFPPGLNRMSPIQDSILNSIHTSIVKNNLLAERTSKQGSIIKVEVTSADALFSRLVTERVVEKASELYMNIRTGTALDNIRQLQSRSDSLLILLNSKSYTAAARRPLDLNPAITTATVPVEIATRDKNVLATLYAEVTKNLEVSKLLLSQQTPVIQLLDQPAYLLANHKKGIKMLIVVGFVAGAALMVGCLFIWFLFFGTGKRPID